MYQCSTLEIHPPNMYVCNILDYDDKIYITRIQQLKAYFYIGN